jgi:hypothetical protein
MAVASKVNTTVPRWIGANTLIQIDAVTRLSAFRLLIFMFFPSLAFGVTTLHSAAQSCSAFGQTLSELLYLEQT